MSMQFCPHCKTPLKFAKFEGKNLIYCSCGYNRFSDTTLSSDEKISHKKVGKGVAKQKRNKLSDFPHECTKCGHEGCEVISLGPAYSDESDRILYICGKCGHVDRQADGSSNG